MARRSACACCRSTAASRSAGSSRALRAGVDVVVATPGRALDHLRRGSLQLAGVRVVVLDEADEMLDMGFAEDIEAMLAESPAGAADRALLRDHAAAHRGDRQAQPARPVAHPHRQGRRARRARRRRSASRPTSCPAQRKMPRSAACSTSSRPPRRIVFCRTRTEVDELTETLNARGYQAEALHGGMTQEQRDRVMRRLRAGDAELLIATDVAARGLDIEHLSHVINYDVPAAPEAYVHRIGRVGRAGREGVAITLVEPREHRLLRNIERLTKQKIEIAKVPTVADLRARRLELTAAALREAILADDKEHFRVVVDALSDEYDLVDIAMAAVRLYHQATVGDGEDENEEIEARAFPSSDAGAATASPVPARPSRGPRGGGEMARLYIAAGRQAGIRPQDLVGAIANEAGVPGSSIGAIQITDRFSLVEVPEETAEHVIKMLKSSNLRGKKVAVRRDQTR